MSDEISAQAALNISGRIKVGSRGKTAPPVQANFQLIGRIKAGSGVRVAPPFFLHGNIKATSGARSPTPVYLFGVTRSASEGRAVIDVPPQPINLFGRARARSGADSRDLYMGSGVPSVFIDGKITATSALRALARRLPIDGRIKATSAAVAHTTYLSFVAKTKGTSGIKVWRLFSTPNILYLSAAIGGSSSRGQAQPTLTLPASKISSVRSSARAEYSITAVPLQLSGKISARSSVRTLPAETEEGVFYLSASRVWAKSSAKHDGTLIEGILFLFASRLWTQSSARQDETLVPVFRLSGNIAAKSSGVTELAPEGAYYLFGRTATGITSIRSTVIAIQGVVYFDGTIHAQSSGAKWRIAFGTFPYFFPDQTISARSGMAWVGYQWLAESKITAASGARFEESQLLAYLGQVTARSDSSGRAVIELLLFYAEPPDIITRQVDDFLDLITSEHNQQPSYMATVDFSISPYMQDLPLVASLPITFDVDWAVGEQEDFVGQWVGRTRFVNLGNVFFSFDYLGLGFDQANWRGAFDPPGALIRLDDYHYRLLLYATIVANHWNGSVPVAYHAWDTLFAGTGIKVIIQDYGNMTMLYGVLSPGVPDRVLQALLTNGHMDLRPEGIEILYYVFQAAPDHPYFAFDAESDAVAGWDVGWWGVLIEPGGAYLPPELPPEQQLLLEGATANE